MATNNHKHGGDELVYGETARDVFFGFTFVRKQLLDEGKVQLSVSLADDPAPPVRRALLRAEAALLLEDAAAADSDGLRRPPADRRQDAITAVVAAAAEAIDPSSTIIPEVPAG